MLKEMLGCDDMDKNFDSLLSQVSDKTLRAIRNMGFTQMMEIQRKSIRPLFDYAKCMGQSLVSCSSRNYPRCLTVSVARLKSTMLATSVYCRFIPYKEPECGYLFVYSTHMWLLFSVVLKTQFLLILFDLID